MYGKQGRNSPVSTHNLITVGQLTTRIQYWSDLTHPQRRWEASITSQPSQDRILAEYGRHALDKRRMPMGAEDDGLPSGLHRCCSGIPPDYRLNGSHRLMKRPCSDMRYMRLHACRGGPIGLVIDSSRFFF